MEIIARVFDKEITRSELDYEEQLLCNQDPHINSNSLQRQALENLIDRYLLMHEAECCGFSVTDEEFDQAMLEWIDDPFNTVLINRKGRELQIERIIKSDILIKKYISYLCQNMDDITDEQLYQFFGEKQDIFKQDVEVRASHILIKGHSQEAWKKINQLYNSIKTPADFLELCSHESQCPSCSNCGDLGYFPKGIIAPEIEKVAFSLNINEISKPFKSHYGYHILMVTDKRENTTISFEQIKDSLKQSLCRLEQELMLVRLLKDIRNRNSQYIIIYRQ